MQQAYSKLFVFLFILFTTCKVIQAQTILQGKVIDAESNKSLSFVNININQGEKGTSSNLDGDFFIETDIPIHQITFSHIGYESFQYSITSGEDLKPFTQKITIKLYPKEKSLKEIVIDAGDNPANRIIRKASKNRRLNNPENIKSFRYQAYNKFYLTLEDLVSSRDSTMIAETIDSTAQHLLNYFKQKHSFVSETVSERSFLKPYYNKQSIIAQRVSGFQQPHLVSIATDLHPLSLSKDYIHIFEKDYLNPLSKGSSEKYFFSIEDTTYFKNDTIYVISFTPYPNKNFDGMEGLLYINTNRYAIQNIIASSADHQVSPISFKIQQHYELIENQWFPTQLQAKIFFNRLKIAQRKYVGVFRSDLQNIELFIPLKPKDFGSTTIDISSQVPSEEKWQSLRSVDLTDKEKHTYQYLDSLGRKYKFDKILQIGENFTYGRYPIGWLDLDLNNILRINRYEGLRIGVGFQTNSNFHNRLTLGAYIAYGTKDTQVKYGGNVEISIWDRFNFNVGTAYQDDVSEPANLHFIKERPLFSSTSFRYFLTERMDKVQKIDLYSYFRPLQNTLIHLSLNSGTITPRYSYQFTQVNNDQTSVTEDSFRFTSFTGKLRYTFHQKYLKFGKYNLFLKSAYPVINFHYNKGLKILDGKYEYNKYSIEIEQQFTSTNLGKTHLKIQGGIIEGNAPYPILFQGLGATRNLPLVVDGYFQTMELYEFLSDRFLNVFLTHNFGKLLFKPSSKIFQPEFVVVQSFGFGQLSHPERHQDIAFKTLEQGFFESGILINNLLQFNYINIANWGLGAGTYVRYGNYAYRNLSDNLFFKITSSFSF